MNKLIMVLLLAVCVAACAPQVTGCPDPDAPFNWDTRLGQLVAVEAKVAVKPAWAGAQHAPVTLPAAPCGLDPQMLVDMSCEEIRKKSNALNVWVVPGIAEHWDLIVVFWGGAEDAYFPEQEGPAQIFVFPRNAVEPMQMIDMENMYVELDAEGQISSNQVELYGENNSPIVAEDFNFDGLPDLALRNGNHGPYAGPSYLVYLHNPGRFQLDFSEAFTVLGHSSLMLFDVDAEKKQLLTFDKNGCCWHVISRYRVMDNEPVLVGEQILDNRQKAGITIITERELVDGVWHERTWEEEYQEE